MITIGRAARFLGLVAVQLALVAILLELIGRLLDPLGISYYPETARYLDTLKLEEPIGYRNRPGLSATFYGVPVTINALGMREKELAAKAPGEFRILVLGDSVTFGIGVRYEDALPQQLELVLNERRAARRYRFLNLGVPSYNTEQQLIQLRTLGLELDPDAVILVFSPNDIEPKMWVLDKRSRWYVNMAQRSYAATLLYVLWRELRPHLGTLAALQARAGSYLPDGEGSLLGAFRPDNPRWLVVDRSLTAINALLHARHVPFVLFTVNDSPAILELLEGVASREGFPLVNLQRHADPRWKKMDEALFHNSRMDGHPSPLGNRALAILIAESLQRLGVLGRSNKLPAEPEMRPARNQDQR